MLFFFTLPLCCLQVIAAEGEMNASRALKEASLVIAESPSALQLRYLQTLNTIAAEKNSTIIFPVPIDMMQAFIKHWTESHIKLPTHTHAEMKRLMLYNMHSCEYNVQPGPEVWDHIEFWYSIFFKLRNIITWSEEEICKVVFASCSSNWLSCDSVEIVRCSKCSWDHLK